MDENKAVSAILIPTSLEATTFETTFASLETAITSLETATTSLEITTASIPAPNPVSVTSDANAHEEAIVKLVQKIVTEKLDFMAKMITNFVELVFILSNIEGKSESDKEKDKNNFLRLLEEKLGKKLVAGNIKAAVFGPEKRLRLIALISTHTTAEEVLDETLELAQDYLGAELTIE